MAKSSRQLGSPSTKSRAGLPATPKSSRSRPSTASPKSKRSPSKKTAAPPPDPGVIPGWCDPRISLRCWETIFLYAANDGVNVNSGWLLNAATTCKVFAEAAISALYRCPTLMHPAKVKKLAALLQRPETETLFNYRAKIEELQLEINVASAAVMAQLIQPAYRLRELTVYTTLDQPPYRTLNTPSRWKYPPELFEALLPAAADTELGQYKTFPTRLTAWEWSGRFIGGHVPDLDAIARIHATPSFVGLERISFTNFQQPSLFAKTGRQTAESEMETLQKDRDVVASIVRAITALPQLTSLCFESSTVMNGELLPQLPKNLTKLELINCWEVNSTDFAAFLKTHGSHMRILKLHHNQSLDLAFLTSLAESCPELCELNMNLSYFRLHDSIDDSDPFYDHALLPDQVPTWPSTLRAVVVENIRKWDLEAAEVFLNSLLDRAQHLPHLRVLSIKTMLDIPWQRRATLRIEWKEKMEQVFLRHSEPPMNFYSLRNPPSSSSTTAGEDSTRKRKEPPTALAIRRSSRVPTTGTDDAPRATKRQASSRRTSRPSYRDLDTDEEETDDGYNSFPTSDESDHAPSSPPEQVQHIQGMCRVVNILFDNQKVRELQYGMEDFRSDEDTDEEEDWDGDEDDEDDRVIQF